MNGLDIKVGTTSAQSFLELLALFVCLVLWGDSFVTESLRLVGDNIGALSGALHLKGAGPTLAIAREIAWRKARRRWSYVAGHIASEANVVPDAVSRLADPVPASFPASALSRATQRACPDVASLWKL